MIGVFGKKFVVLDGVEGSQYDGIGGIPVFSPDSAHLAYAARSTNRWCVVADERVGQTYDAVIVVGGGAIHFQSPDTLHYLVQKHGANGCAILSVVDMLN